MIKSDSSEPATANLQIINLRRWPAVQAAAVTFDSVFEYGAGVMHWGAWAMKAFIAAVIVLGLFGPYVISVILGALCLALWVYFRHDNESAGNRF